MKDLDSHKGGCWCGLVRYESYGEPTYAGICHCRYCQLRTGSAFGVSIYFPDELLKIKKMDRLPYTVQKKVFLSLTQPFEEIGLNRIYN